MPKTHIKNQKSAKAHVRPFSLLLLASICLFSPLVVYNAHAAATVNPSGSTIAGMDAGDGSAQNPAVVAPHPTVFNNPILENRGTISGGLVVGFGRSGMYSNVANTNHNFSNFGTIDVWHDNAGGNAYVFGMDVASAGNHTFTNSGSITARAISATSGANAYGMNASGHGTRTFSNSGTITATATGAGAGGTEAFGMLVAGNPAPGTVHTLNNTGTINAYATSTGGGMVRAFEAYGSSSYSVGTWATTLRPWTGNDAVFGGDVGVTFNNSKLILRADNRTVMGQDYRIYDATNDNGMVSALYGITVGGTIAEAVSESPTLKATLVGGNNPATATVRLEPNVNSSTTPNPTATQQSVFMTLGQMANIARELRQITFNNISSILLGDAGTSDPSGSSGVSAGSSMDENKWLVFINPYANAVSNSEYNFNGSHMGITVGGSYKVSDKFSLGAHFDFNAANYSAEVYDMQSKSTSFALGLHGTYNFTPEFYLQGQITGAISQTDSYYELGGITPADADSTYNGESLFMALNAGYVWMLADDGNSKHSLTPVLGLSYLSTRTAAYDVDWGNAALDIYDMKYDDTYYSALYGNVNLDWRSEWALQNDSSIALIAGVGIRQNLSASEVVSNLRTLGGSYSTRTSEDMTTWLADVGVEYRKGNFSVSLNYDGSYGIKQTSHGGNLMFKIEF